MNCAPCIVCGRELEDEGDLRLQPSGGTSFTTHGHYGSGVFDAEPGMLAINVCDACMLESARLGRVYHVLQVVPKAQPPEVRVWAPDAAARAAGGGA